MSEFIKNTNNFGLPRALLANTELTSITNYQAAVTGILPVMHCGQKCLKKAEKIDVTQEVDLFIVLNISSLGDLVPSLFSNFHFTLAMHSAK